MANKNVQTMHGLSIQTKIRVRDLYAQIASGFPSDEVAGRYVAIMEKSIKGSIILRQRQIDAAKRNAERQKTQIDNALKLKPSI